MKKSVFVVWAREIKLSQFIARDLGSELIISYKPEYKGYKLPVLFRYAYQALDTYKKLKFCQPNMIFVQNPPIFSVLTVFIYCRINNACYAIDTHTAGFLDRKWRFFHFLHKFLAKRAALNTVHNYKNCEVLRRWGIFNNYVLQFYNPETTDILKKNVNLPRFINQKLKKQLGFKIFMVNRFASDDAYSEVIETARLLPKAIFFITGDDSKISEQLKQSAPANVLFTGYLEHTKFIKLMDNCDLILALTKRKDTVLWSLREIMALDKPFVTSDSEVLKHYFKKIGIFAKAKPQEIKKKIIEAWEKRFELKGEIVKYVKKDKERWKKDMEVINSMLEEYYKSNCSCNHLASKDFRKKAIPSKCFQK
jgi:hypothetical protein